MPVIYGDNQIIEDIRIELYDQMVALRAAMVAGSTAPLPAAIYNSHEQVKMTLPAISVGINDVQLQGELVGRSAAGSGAVKQIYTISCDIRVHTDYEGGYLDQVTLTRLLNSVSNWLTSHDNLGIGGLAYFEVTRLTIGHEFSESLTIGGRIEITMKINLLHSQV